jgi:O-antigen/teichoic acid export membrane protein
VASALASIYAGFQCKPFLSKELSPTAEVVAKNFHFGKWSLGSLLGGIFMVQIIAWIVALSMGTAATAKLEAPRLVMAPLQVLLIGSSNIFTPIFARKFSQGSYNALARTIFRVSVPWVGLFLVYALIVGANSDYWLSLLFGDKYTASANLLIVWLLIYVLLGLRHLPMIAFNAIKRPEIGMWLSLAAGGLTVILVTLFLHIKNDVSAALIGRLAGDLILSVAVITGFFVIIKRRAK